MRALLIGAALVFVDAFWLNQGFISLFFGIGVVLIGLPRALLPRFKAVRSKRLINLGVYLAAVVLVLTLNRAQQNLAANRGEQLVTAVKAFHTKYQQYPDSLNALVPEFIANVPPAKYTMTYSQFSYIKTDTSATLFYTEVPPFGRRAYVFSRGTWARFD